MGDQNAWTQINVKFNYYQFKLFLRNSVIEVNVIDIHQMMKPSTFHCTTIQYCRNEEYRLMPLYCNFNSNMRLLVLCFNASNDFRNVSASSKWKWNSSTAFWRFQYKCNWKHTLNANSVNHISRNDIHMYTIWISLTFLTKPMCIQRQTNSIIISSRAQSIKLWFSFYFVRYSICFSASGQNCYF